MYKALMIEDHKEVRDFVKEYFNHKEIEVVEAQNGYEGLSLLDDTIDIILLDIMVPGIDGYEVCKQLRLTTKRPVIFMSALSQEENQLLAYQLGADDYIIKPFDAKELIARVKAVLRRYQPGKSDSASDDKGKCVSYPGITINLTNYSVVVDNIQVEMPPKELELLYFLASSPNQVFTRQQLLDQIWGYEYIGDTRTVDVHIKRIREKIKNHDTWGLATVWGIGYKFEVK